MNTPAVNSISKKQIFTSIILIILMWASYAVLRLHHRNQETRLHKILGEAYDRCKKNLANGWQALDDLGNNYLKTNDTIISHQVTQQPHPSLSETYLLSTDITQIPDFLKNRPNWPEIEVAVLLSRSIAAKTHSPCYTDKGKSSFFWICTPLYKAEKHVGYALAKRMVAIDEFAKSYLTRFFLVQEFKQPIALSDQNPIPENLPALADEDIFNPTTFVTRFQTNKAIFSTRFDAGLTFGFVAMYPKGPSDTIFSIAMFCLILLLLLLWIKHIIIGCKNFGSVLHAIFIKRHPAAITFLCIIFGLLSIYYTAKIHKAVQATRINLETQHARRNIYIAQKINNIFYVHKDKTTSAIIDKALQEYTPPRINLVELVDRSGKVVNKFIQHHGKERQNTLCNIIGTSQSHCVVEIPQWTLRSTSVAEYQELPLQLLRQSLILLAIAFMLFLLSLWYALNIIFEKSLAGWAIAVYPLFILCNCALWVIVDYIPVVKFDTAGSIKSAADNALLTAKMDIIAGNKQLLPPQRVTLGALFQQLDLTQVNTVSIQALIWQIINSNNEVGFVLPDAKDIKVEEVHKTEGSSPQKILWRIHGKVASPDNYREYPFSVKQLKIGIAIKNVQTPTLLLPDQTLFSNKSAPWLSQDVVTPGFTMIEHSITSEVKASDTLKNVAQGLSNRIFFNLTYRESLAGALFTYVLPLLIILMAMFGILWVPDSVRFTAYSGVFFADILLHRTLRGSLSLVDICYLDCFFFFTYMGLVALMIGTLFTLTIPRLAPQIDFYSKQFYWPIQFVLWIMTTAWFFC